MEYKTSNYGSIMPSYLENPVLQPRHFYHTGLEKSLERIVLNEEPEREKDIIDKVFSDKSRTLRATVKALFNEIMLRERLDSFLIYDINKDIGRQHNYLDSFKEFHRFNYSLSMVRYLHDTKMRAEGSILDLQSQKRNEYLTCWKDLMFLKKYLLSALKEEWNLNSRKSFLDVENDKPGHRIDMQETEAYNW